MDGHSGCSMTEGVWWGTDSPGLKMGPGGPPTTFVVFHEQGILFFTKDRIGTRCPVLFLLCVNIFLEAKKGDMIAVTSQFFALHLTDKLSCLVAC